MQRVWGLGLIHLHVRNHLPPAHAWQLEKVATLPTCAGSRGVVVVLYGHCQAPAVAAGFDSLVPGAGLADVRGHLSHSRK